MTKILKFNIKLNTKQLEELKDRELNGDSFALHHIFNRVSDDNLYEALKTLETIKSWLDSEEIKEAKLITNEDKIYATLKANNYLDKAIKNIEKYKQLIKDYGAKIDLNKEEEAK
jgi:hypothetical protein